MKLLKLPSALYYQQSVLMALYFEVNYVTLWGFNSFFIFALYCFNFRCCYQPYLNSVVYF